jgi:hypothetical protein
MITIVDFVNVVDQFVGVGAQFEKSCDISEHDEDSGCIFCEARAVLHQYLKESD